MQESPKVLYIGTPNGARAEAGHLAKLAGLSRYAEVRGWRLVPVAWSRGLRRKVPSLLRGERPAGCIVECSAALGPWLPPPLFAGIPTVWLEPAGAWILPDGTALGLLSPRQTGVQIRFWKDSALHADAEMRYPYRTLAPGETWAPEHRPFVIGGTASGGESGWREFCNEVKRIENTAR